MPYRKLAAKELGTLLGVLSHPDRLRIIEELRLGERDVATLSQALDVPHAKASQQLGILRAHRLVEERREGRHVFYRLSQSDLAQWLTGGLSFIHDNPHASEQVRNAAELAKAAWSDEDASQSPG